jgi:hypothetical protein
MIGVVMFDTWEEVIFFFMDMDEEFIVWYANEVVLNFGILFLLSS